MGDYIKLWGTRGSIPVSGQGYCQFGGNTSCVEICYHGHCVIIDGGSGIRPLGYEIQERGLKEMTVVLSHLHWDHITGLPFFAPLYDPEASITLAAPALPEGLKSNLDCLFRRQFFPGSIDALRARVTYSDVEFGTTLEFGELKLCCGSARHPGGAFCFKIVTPHRCIGYCSDNEFLEGFTGTYQELLDSPSLLKPYQEFIDFFKDCDLLIHEAQYPDEVYPKVIGWGHSSVSNICALLDLLGTKEHLVIHHDPIHTDADLREKCLKHQEALDRNGTDCRVSYVGDGHVILLNDLAKVEKPL